MKYIIIGIAIIAFGFTACAPLQPDMSQQPLPTGTIHTGTLANPKLKMDATRGVFAKLMSKGYDMKGEHHIMPYVVSMPSGPIGSRHWTEKWYVTVVDKKIPVTINFKESGLGAADWRISE